MKHTFLLAFVAIGALFVGVSCQKEDMGRILTATLEQYQSDSKAYINASNYACWENNDQVSINGGEYIISLDDDLNRATIAIDESLTGSNNILPKWWRGAPGHW